MGLSLFQPGELGWVDIDPDHLNASSGEAGAGDKAHIAATEDCDCDDSSRSGGASAVRRNVIKRLQRTVLGKDGPGAQTRQQGCSWRSEGRTRRSSAPGLRFHSWPLWLQPDIFRRPLTTSMAWRGELC